MIHEGNLKIGKENQALFSHITEITGDLSVYADAKFEAPKLETVGGDVFVHADAKLEALTTVGGDVFVHADAKLEAPKLETVGGDLSVYADAKFEAPKLETVGGDVYAYANFDAPNLKMVGGDVSVYPNANFNAPKLETVGGYVSAFSNSKIDAPKLKNKNAKQAKEKCQEELEIALSMKSLILADGILSWVLSVKQRDDIEIFKIKIVGSTKTSFLVARGNTFSHGETIKEAIDDLIFKFSDRDLSEFEYWKKDLDQVVSLEAAMQGYRAITGACRKGIKRFVRGIQVPDPLTVGEIARLTKGKFGSDRFVKFIKER